MHINILHVFFAPNWLF